MKPKMNAASMSSSRSTGGGGLRRRAESRLREGQNGSRNGQGPPPTGAELESSQQRLFHELQVHQVELEMQNMELQEARDRAECLLEKYTDQYELAPVGYFSLDASGLILDVNLTGAA